MHLGTVQKLQLGGGLVNYWGGGSEILRKESGVVRYFAQKF
jgi:hypothetical protein